MHSERLSTLYLGLTILALLAISCTKSSEAVTRQDQEKMFGELLGFAPPKAVTEIKYRDVYNRHLMDGAWGRWMGFTYSEEVFSKIVKGQGYRKRDAFHFADLDSAAAPEWWPKVDQSKVTIYWRSDKDTQASEGYSFQEYVWHDTNSNFVYFHKRYWD